MNDINNKLYVYLKMAHSLKKSIVSAFNTGTYGSVNGFIKRYENLRKLVEAYIVPELKTTTSDVINYTYSNISQYNLPNVQTTAFNFEMADKFNEVMMATDQLIALLEGLSGSFEKEINKLLEEKKQIENELKSIKPLFPSQIVIKIPSKLHKTINEANDSYLRGNWTATGILLRKIVDNSLHLKCQINQCEDKLRDNNTSDFYDLPKKIDVCAGLGIINHNRAKDLKKIKLYGDSGAHSLKIELSPQDIEEARPVVRVLLEELFG